MQIDFDAHEFARTGNWKDPCESFAERNWKDKLLKRAPVFLQVQRLQSSKEGEATTNLLAALREKLKAIGDEISFR